MPPFSILLYKNTPLIRLSVLVVLSLLLMTGCPNSNKGVTLPPVKTGSLSHGSISGLEYQTETLTGTTDDSGSYQYRQGEIITFKIGDIELASLPADANFTLLDFDPGYDRAGDSYVPDDRVINILQFLHTISDASNSKDIKITAEIRAAAEDQTINFDQSNTSFASDPNVADVLSQLTSARSQGERELLDALDVQIYLTENLSQKYGQNVDWSAYLNLDHGNLWTYTRTITDNGQSSMDTVSSFMLASVWKEDKIWLQGWSDNWKPDQYAYIAEPILEDGIRPPNFDNSVSGESMLGTSTGVLYSSFVPDKWLVYRTVVTGNPEPVQIKIETLDQLEVSTTAYPNVIKQSLYLPGSNTLIERWYASGVGMIKEVTTASTQQMVELASLDNSDIFPDNETVNKYLGLHYLYDFIIKGNNAVFDAIDEANKYFYIYYGLTGDIGSTAHVNDFHALYKLAFGDHAISLINKITELNTTYGLDSETTGNLINFHYNEAVLHVLLLSVALASEDPDLTQTIIDNIDSIYQHAIDLLVDQGDMQPYDLYLYIDY